MDPILTIVAGATILTVIGIMSGGTFLLRIATGGMPFNALQKAFFRAGHAHAGVLLVLSIAILGVVDAVRLPLVFDLLARDGVPIAAILMPAGFFLSVLGKDPQRPNRLVVLLWIGAAVLTLGLASAGIGLILAGASAL